MASSVNHDPAILRGHPLYPVFLKPKSGSYQTGDLYVPLSVPPIFGRPKENLVPIKERRPESFWPGRGEQDTPIDFGTRQ